MRRAASSRGGFTLVEVLLALSIFAVLLVLLLGGFSGASKALDLLRSREGSFRRTAAALDRIAADLSGSVDTQRLPAIHMDCRDDTLAGLPASSIQFAAFTLPDPGSPRPSTDLCKLKYSVRIAEGGDRLDLYRERSDLPLVESRIPAREGRIAAGLRGFEVELSDGSRWVRTWPPSDGARGVLPVMAAVTITDGEGRPWRRVLRIPLSGSEMSNLHAGRRSQSSP